MSKVVLVTGGAGFIGSHLCDALLRAGYKVRVLDSLLQQVHGPELERPEYLSPEVEFMLGDVRDAEAVRRALIDVDAVYHFAARVGVGQSMYEIASYTATNNDGTAVLLEALIKKPVERLVVASSMSIYGEGLYRNAAGDWVGGTERPLDQLQRRDWEVRDQAGNILTPVATPETKRPTLASVYALSKYDQERMCMMIGRAYKIPTVALRFFNVFGTRQALSNPYTGVLAIFSSRLMNDQRPMVFEDGLQRRDFVHVKDVAQACRLALEVPEAGHQVFNVGSGNHYTVQQIAQAVARVLNKEYIEPEITQNYRVGDIRHCFADISLAQRVLGYAPRVSLEEGLKELSEWLDGQQAVDLVAQARAELKQRGLTV
jgi:dTDP-L-rhamnose 4-epimerase